MDTILETVFRTRVVAIVRGLDSGYARLAQALYDGGIRAVEVTFNQKQPDSFAQTAAAIKEIRAAMGSAMYVGAGTVTSVELVQLAHRAGAAFIVSPNTDPDVIRHTKALGMCSMPGAMTPSEILTAYRAGADFVKVFPAGALGADYIRAIRAPLNQIPLLAVGGISEQNAAEFIQAGCAGIGAGGNLVNKRWIAEGQWDSLTVAARTLCSSVQQ